MNIAAVLSGGTGTRMGADIPKQYQEAAGKPVIVHTLEQMQRCSAVDGVVVTVHVSGKAEEVDAAVSGLEVHHPETIGRSKGVTVFLKPGQKVDESRDVSVQPVSLQRAFVALCGEEEGKS